MRWLGAHVHVAHLHIVRSRIVHPHVIVQKVVEAQQEYADAQQGERGERKWDWCRKHTRFSSFHRPKPQLQIQNPCSQKNIFLSCFNLLRSFRFSGQICRIPTSSSDRKQNHLFGVEKIYNDMRRRSDIRTIQHAQND